MTNRPLHAVQFPASAGGRLLDALAAALDGTGPAILPVDPALPSTSARALLRACAPATLETAAEPGRIVRIGHGEPVADDIAVVLATSGSTGRPKAVELTAAALTASARASLARLGAEPGERWLCGLPTHHISGLGILVRSLVTGSTPLIVERLDPDNMAEHGCAYTSLVPTQLQRLLDAGVPLARFRAVLLGGAAIPPGMLAAADAAGARIVTTYGMTETCGGCVYDGAALPGVEVAIDTESRIRIAGPVLFSGYRLAPDLTAAVLDDGWFVTSDLGQLSPQGRLVLRGRADDVINSGGEKVVPGDVEDVLRTDPAVRDVVVIGVPDPDWGERVTAVVVPVAAGAPPTLDQLRLAVAARLPRYAAPRELVVVPAIPMLASGKPDRQRLRDVARQATDDAPIR